MIQVDDIYQRTYDLEEDGWNPRKPFYRVYHVDGECIHLKQIDKCGFNWKVSVMSITYKHRLDLYSTNT